MSIIVDWITVADVKDLMSEGASSVMTDDDATGDTDSTESFIEAAINNIVATEVHPALIRWMALSVIQAIEGDSTAANWLKGVTVPIVVEYLFARRGSEIPPGTKVLADRARTLLSWARRGRDDGGATFTVPGLNYKINEADDLMRRPPGVPRVANPC